MDYIAHKKDETNEFQTVKEHSEGTARLCQQFSIPLLKNLLYNIGVLHDIGKYQETFQKKISKDNTLKIEHSICGAIESFQKYGSLMGSMAAYCIAGHHSGIPNGGNRTDTDMENTLNGRLKRKSESYEAYKNEIVLNKITKKEMNSMVSGLFQNCMQPAQRNDFISQFALLTYYMFSCLTDADSIDTAQFYRQRERKLKADFQKCLEAVNIKLNSFQCETQLQKTRSELQVQVFQKTDRDSEIYLMNMPTGSGKTLCSVKFALERAIKKNKKRIIYIIPYNSIIDQTVSEFETLFKDNAEILRHQSTVNYETENENFNIAAKVATENWDAPFIVTTAVQFLESIYANKRGKLRKFHNMQDSILIFDEAHLMPVPYLQPCLQAITFITKYLNSEAVFLTATMPDYKKLLQEFTYTNSTVADLITNTTKFDVFKKNTYVSLGESSIHNLVYHAEKNPSSLIVVNSRKKANEVYQECRKVYGPQNCYHLSTYMTSINRREVIKEIKESLRILAKDYPNLNNVPKERKIVVVSTSLIEVGVDLDFLAAYRELTGLDSVLQTGGRCNREGKYPSKDSCVYVFEFDSVKRKVTKDMRQNITRGLIEKNSDLSSLGCIREYYQKLFEVQKGDMKSNSIYHGVVNHMNIPFRTYAENFQVIDSAQISIVVPTKEIKAILDTNSYVDISFLRKLQGYICSVYQSELENLLQTGAVKVHDSGIYYLVNSNLYSDETGIFCGTKDYII